MQDRARAYRQVLSLLLALRRPTYYLVRHREALADQTDQYLRVLATANVISHRLRDAALQQRVRVQPRLDAAPRTDFVADKAADAVRMRLLSMLGLDNTYALDRLDLRVNTTLDRAHASIRSPPCCAASPIPRYCAKMDCRPPTCSPPAIPAR